MAALAALLMAAPASAEESYSKKGVTQEGGALPAKLSGYELTGDVKRCFRSTNIKSSRPLDDFHILFKLRNGDEYLNRLNHRCSGLKIEGAYKYTTGIAQLCHLEIITVISTSTGTPRGSCGLGRFEKIQKVASK